MAYKQFSTRQADYSLVYAEHTAVTKEDIFDDEAINSLDAIVLENSGFDPRIMEMPIIPEAGCPVQYEYIGKQAHKHKKPIYFVDVGAYMETMILETLLLHKRFIIDMLLLDEKSGMPAIKEGAMDSELARATVAMINRIPPTPLVEIRNAISARKLEDYLAPELSGLLGRKPNLALVYGAGHAGIEFCIKSKIYRDILLKAYLLTGYAGLCTETFNDIWEAMPSERASDSFPILGLEWRISRYNCRLF